MWLCHMLWSNSISCRNAWAAGRHTLINGSNVLYKGVINARRDYCRFAEDTYDGMVGMVVIGQSSRSIKGYVDRRMRILLMGTCDLDNLVVSKSLSEEA